MKLDKYTSYSSLVLRLGLGFVFIWFGLSGLITPEIWVDLVPSWTSAIASAKILVLIHGAIELIGGFLLCSGIKVRWVAAILFLNLAHILILLDFGPIFIRDVGLAMALIAIWLQGE